MGIWLRRRGRRFGGAEGVPANAILDETGEAILDETGGYILDES